MTADPTDDTDAPEPAATAADHRWAWDQIPWIVAGGAVEADRARVMAHVAACADCAAELAFHEAVRDGMQLGLQAPTSLHDAARAEAGWQQLQARLDDMGPTPGHLPEAVVATHPDPRWRWRWAAAAVIGAQALGLATLGGMLWERPRPAGYVTLSQSPALSPERAAARIRLVPAPGLTLAELQALVEHHGLALVEASPDARHFGLAPRAGGAAVDDALIARLRAEPGVRLVEPVGRGR